jgi:hypothetical protein
LLVSFRRQLDQSAQAAVESERGFPERRLLADDMSDEGST